MCQVSDRFFSAVRILTGDGPVKQRLLRAYKEHLDNLRVEEVPESIRQKFESLRQALHAVQGIRGENPVDASVRKMSPADAQRYVTSILLMLSELVRVKGTNERLSFAKPGRQAPEPAPTVIPGVIQLRSNKAS